MILWRVTLRGVAIAVAGLNFAALRLVAQQRIDTNRRLLQERGKLLGTSMAGLGMIETLKATGAESDFFSRWAGYQAHVINAENALGVSSEVLAAVPPFLSTLSLVAVIGFGGLRVLDGYLTIGMLVAFQTLMASFLEPIGRLVRLGAVLQEAEGDMQRLDDVLRSKADGEVAPGRTKTASIERPRKLTGYLEFRHARFGYSPVA